MPLPQIIQGGMGVGVSGWMMARAVAEAGQLGVVSGTALDTVFARRLQSGDPGGHLRRAVDAFPFPEMGRRIWERYFIEGGKAVGKAFRSVSMFSEKPARDLLELTVLANFVEVFLAKEGHPGKVGINFLEKIQLPTLPSIFGALLAGVDVVLMGAGIPRAIPGILEQLVQGKPASLKLDVEAANGEEFCIRFDPADFCGGIGKVPVLRRPKFLAIISSATLALTMARKSSGKVDGFVVEGPSAGGHNAPPRGDMQLDCRGEPIYGERDLPDLDKIRAIGLPFWLAGSFGRPGGMAEAQAKGAIGIQVGTAFAFCEESGITTGLKKEVIQGSRQGSLSVHTDPHASPTGFPFKIIHFAGSSDREGDPAPRKRVCDLGYLRHPYRKDDGSVGYRCPGEPAADFAKKGGIPCQAKGSVCLCNGLLATIGLGQVRDTEVEAPLLTAGDDVVRIADFVPCAQESYTAADVIRALLK